MIDRARVTVHRLLAIAAAFLALIAATLLSAAPVFAQVPPPEPELPAVNPRSTTPDPSGMPLWTYVLVACIALLIGAALTHAVTRSRTSHSLDLLDEEPTAVTA